MKAYTVELPLRTIHLKLQDKAPISIESTGLVLYQDLHQELWGVKQAVEEYKTNIEHLQSIVNNLGEAYTALEAETKRYGKIAGYSEEQELQNFLAAGDTEYSVNLHHLNHLADTFSEIRIQYMDKCKVTERSHALVEERQEKFNESIIYFKRNYFSPMLQAYDALQVDTCSFDDDVNEFLVLCGKIDEPFDRLVDDWEALCTAATEISGNMKRLNKHIECISNTLMPVPIHTPDPGLN